MARVYSPLLRQGRRRLQELLPDQDVEIEVNAEVPDDEEAVVCYDLCIFI